MRGTPQECRRRAHRTCCEISIKSIKSGRVDSIHDVLEEGLEGGKGELSARVRAGGKEEQEHARNGSRNCHRSLTTNVLQVYSVATKERARNTNNRGDGVVAVGGRNRVGTATAVVGEVLRKEGIKQRIAHADRSPCEPNEDGSGTKLPAIEKRSDALSRKLSSSTLDNVNSTELSVFSNIGIAANLVQNLLGQPSSGLVVSGNSLDNVNSLGLATTRQQEFGRLEKVEEEESKDEHAKGDGTESQDEVAPAPVVSLVADRGSSSAREIGNVSPSQKGRDQLTDGPPDRQKSEKIVRLARQELEEKGAIDRKVTANTKADTGVESTYGNPAIGATSGETECASNEKRHVESIATTDDIRDDTPETGSDTETGEEGESSVSNSVCVDIKLGGDGIKSQSDTLKPEVVCHPTETTKSEKLPLVSAHAHVLDSLVDDF